MVPTHSIVRLEAALKAWSTDNFPEVFKQEIEQLGGWLLPLQQGLSQGSYVSEDPINIMIIGVTDDDNSIVVKAGIFYSSIIAGCNCADDPTPVDTIPEYCIAQFQINKSTAETRVDLIKES